MNIEPDVLIEMIKSLRKDYVDHTLEKPIRTTAELNELRDILKEKYSELFDKYESIFNMCLSKSYDFSRMEYFVRMAARVHSGDITEHKASVEVGQLLVNEVVKPQLDRAGVKPKKP
jgi:hypothetical protein